MADLFGAGEPVCGCNRNPLAINYFSAAESMTD
jgi:hypothetical protein